MSDVKEWILTDLDNRVYVEECHLTAAANGGLTGENWSVSKTRLKGGLSDGVDVIDVNNGCLSFTLVPTRGFGLWKGQCGPVQLGWNSPVQNLVNPMFINVLDADHCGWLRGMNECVVRCGFNSFGAPCTDTLADGSSQTLPLHGTIANIPAKFVSVKIISGTPTKIQICGIVDDVRMFGTLHRLITTFTTEAGSRKVSIHDEIVNLADSPVDMEVLYHCNFGMPLVCEGAKLIAPSLEVVPRTPHAAKDIPTWDTYAAPTPGFPEQVHFHRLASDANGDSAVMLMNPSKDQGVKLLFNTRQLPCFTQWKNPIGVHEGYVSGIEPGTNYPNPKPFERENGRLKTLAPRQSYPVDIAIEAQVNAEQVSEAEAQIKALMPKGTSTVLHNELLKGWAP